MFRNEILYLVQALCLNSVNQKQAALASNRKVSHGLKFHLVTIPSIFLSSLPPSIFFYSQLFDSISMRCTLKYNMILQYLGHEKEFKKQYKPGCMPNYCLTSMTVIVYILFMLGLQYFFYFLHHDFLGLH